MIHDSDFTLHVGDVRDVLPTLEAESVDCVVTSPPYWALRDYGVSGQLGLEPTPDEYVTNMVAVFHQVRRVLRPHGTLWLNIGDSYSGAAVGSFNGGGFKDKSAVSGRRDLSGVETSGAMSKLVPGIKPKDLVGIPWLLAFALRADGWWLRAEIIWAKPNPMPESVTDRPTKAHEQVFLLSKAPRYWYDADAIREPATYAGDVKRTNGNEGMDDGFDGHRTRDGFRRGVTVPERRNSRSVWEIPTEPYPDAHFATFPTELARRCILAGCPTQVCVMCGKPRERIVERQNESTYARVQRETGMTYQEMKAEAEANGITPGNIGNTHAPGQRGAYYEPPQNLTVGWTDCGHNNYTPGVVLDPFIGSGTVALVARHHGRRCVGIELSPEYARLCAERTKQLSLLA